MTIWIADRKEGGDDADGHDPEADPETEAEPRPWAGAAMAIAGDAIAVDIDIDIDADSGVSPFDPPDPLDIIRRACASASALARRVASRSPVESLAAGDFTVAPAAGGWELTVPTSSTGASPVAVTAVPGIVVVDEVVWRR